MNRPSRASLVEKFIAKNGYSPSPENPVTFNEKILRRKIYGQDPLMIGLTDKLKARLYVENICPDLKLIPCRVVREDDPPPTKYPVVLKPNNKSGQTKVVHSKREYRKAFENLLRLKDKHYGWDKGEWTYAGVSFEIMVEKVIPHFTEFHLYCFSGKVGMVLVVDQYQNLPSRPTSRGPDGMSLFKPNGTLFDAYIEGRKITHSLRPVSVQTWNRLIDAGTILSKPFDFVRIDLMVTPDRDIYFTEFTFFPASGNYPWRPRTFDTYLGGLWK